MLKAQFYLKSRHVIDENKHNANAIDGDLLRYPRLTISSCLCAFVANFFSNNVMFLLNILCKFGIITIAIEMVDLAENRKS
jgi:hypothetical protein